jgi:ABC-type phosphate transport system substrate-binding protein
MKTIVIVLLLMMFATVSQAEIVVIGNKNNPLAFDSRQLEDIFLGRTHSFSNGNVVLPLDHATLRSEFYQKLTSRPIAQINAYWARILFTGQASPPIVLPDDQAVLSTVSKNKDAIGYIDKKHLNDSVRVLYFFN